ncbi:unnamed protein product [Caenorhabditis bovis]|uniref:Protein ST7 homolog n=1 Tax=Caenorhabditis bovis TaxID=2654633 RepID=A0A8S1FAL4_9PELO|nr:unnamed protein product [Caenorhabditis bovis]
MATCSWTLLWLIWIALVGVLLFCLRGPLKIYESFENASSYFSNLTPKFYVALTGTSSLVSGIILIFEWWYLKNNAMEAASDDGSDNDDSVESTKSLPGSECKVWRNPMALLRGAEYARYRKDHKREPLTYYDMNLSAQDHQSFFTCEDDNGKPDYEIMQMAWRERDSEARIHAAKSALAINEDCAPALILLAEEECETVADAEAMLKRALRATELALANYANNHSQISAYSERVGDVYARNARRRDINMQMYIRRRLAMCARKQGRLREAVKMFKDMSREGSIGAVLNVQENLIEACLEMQAYADVQTLLVKYDGYGAASAYEMREPRSAVLSYTSALLKVRAVAENFRCNVDTSIRRGLSLAEQSAIEALVRAIEFNPHVPIYLLELEPLILPPEHYLKRGDSEALAYAFFHMQHWKRIDGALKLLHYVWRGDFSIKVGVNNYCYPYSPQLESADRELLPSWHNLSVFPKKESMLKSMCQTMACLVTCVVALIVHHYPTNSSQLANNFAVTLMQSMDLISDSLSHWAPTNIISLLASKPVPIMSINGTIDSKKLVEALLGDLRTLSQEAKKKQNHVKEAAEAGLVRIRNINTASAVESSLLTNLRAACSELLHPLVLACATRHTRLVQIALQGIQRLVQHRILSSNGATIVANELWTLVEAECEELRVLQTVPPLVSSELIVTGNTLAKCIVMCFRLHFAKDPVVINAASAAVRQLVSTVFERVIQEDGIFSSELTVVNPAGGRPSPRAAPPTLRPCAADAYMLFRDLCLLINGEAPVWLVGIQEMTRTLGLELLESLLKGYPSVFIRHSEFGGLLSNDVCPLIIRLFSPNVKALQINSQHPSSRNSNYPPTVSADRQSFPIAMRLVRIVTLIIQFYQSILHTECEIFISTLLKFVDGDRKSWQRPLALEALHRIVSSASLVRWMSETFDCRTNSTKVLEQVASGLANVVQQSLVATQFSHDQESEIDRSQEDGSPGFLSKGLWVPYVEQLTPKKTILLDSLDRMDAVAVPDGYVLSRCCVALCDMAQAVYVAVDQLCLPDENAEETTVSKMGIAKVTYANAQPSILLAIGSLLASSTDEMVSDQLLCSLSTLISAGCRVGAGEDLHRSVYVLSIMSLPYPGYLTQLAGIPPPSPTNKKESQIAEQLFDCESWPSTAQVVATGPPCPCPVVSTDLWNRQVALTSKNMQAAKQFIASLTAHVSELSELYYLCLATCQHLTWLLAMRPTQVGQFERETRDDHAAGPTTVTTAALPDIAVLSSYIDKLAPAIGGLPDEIFLKALDSLIRLSDESLAVAATGRDSSQFPLAILYRVFLISLPKLDVFWAKASNHFIKVCNHTSVTMRDWAAVGLTSLAKQAMKAKTNMPAKDQQDVCISSLHALCSIPHVQVRRRQLDCVMSLMQTDGSFLLSTTWPTIIQIISAIIDSDTVCELSLVRQGYLGLRLVSSDFLQSIPFDCVTGLVEAVSRYGRQTTDQNISLSALTLLWTISDFIYRKMDVVGADASEAVWMVLYTCLSESCIDPRFAVRKSACQTLLQTVTAHGHALRASAWHNVIWQIMIPLLDKVRSQTRSASTEKANGELIMHHSRDTEQKQWTETCIHTLSAISKIFNSQRKSLLALQDFGAVWEALLGYLDWAACYENAELSLSAIRSYQEVLLGKVSSQTLNVNSHEKSNCSEAIFDIVAPELPQAQWVDSWKTWLRISRGLARQGCVAQSYSTNVDNKSATSSPRPLSTTSSMASLAGVYVPGPSHLTAILHVFPPLFDKVAKSISVEDLKYESLPAVLESMMNVPIPSEMAPFVLPSSSTHLTPTQEALLDAVKIVFVECTISGTSLRAAIPDQIRLLLKFASLATQRPSPTKTAPGGTKSYKEYALTTIVPFAEYSLRMAIEFFNSTASHPDVANSLIAIDIVRFLGEPLYMKYTCLSPSTWKLAASSLMTVLKTAIPYARQHPDRFVGLWPAICDTMEKFLFTPNRSNRLAADERKRDELMECQAVEIIRVEMLAHASKLPPQDVQRLIGLLHKGSISQVDSTDVLDSHTQRNELAKTCFDALLMSSDANGADASDDGSSLGNVAVISLLQRCTQVMSDFCQDWASSGDLRLPRSRTIEMISALQAVDSLISRLAKDPRMHELYSQLVSLFPSVVDVMRCCHADPQLEDQLIKTIKSYQTLFLLQNIPRAFDQS